MGLWLAVPANRIRLALISLVVIAVVWVVVAAWAALVPFIFGLLVAYILLPVVNWLDDHAPRFLRRRALARPLAIVLVYLVVIGIFVGMMSYFIPTVIEQGQGFGAAVPRYLEQLERLYLYDLPDFMERIPPEIGESINSNIQRAIDTLASAIQKGVGGTIRTLWNTVSFIIGVAIIPFWMYYVLNDNRRIKRGLYSIFPESAQADIRNIEHIVDGLLSSYLRGQLLLCLLVGSMATIVLLIFGVDMALLLGTFAAVFEIIPILGPYLGAIPAVLIVLLTNPLNAIWVALSFAAIQWIENTFMVPRISGDSVRLHPALVMILVVIASQLAGVVGMLFVVPLVAVLRDVVRYLLLRTTERGSTPALAMESLRARQG
ncbi:MAG: AI-2E family transporter [Anaerolineae bacterium]|jgi:predicted PurR-regulated permease PerM